MNNFEKSQLSESLRKAAEAKDQHRIEQLLTDAAKIATRSELTGLAAESYNGITMSNSNNAIQAGEVFRKALTSITGSNSATASAAAQEFLNSLKK